MFPRLPTLHARLARFAGRTAPAALLAAALAATGATTLAAENENWPAFRGADALATADDDPRLPLTWSTTENVVWKPRSTASGGRRRSSGATASS